ncbi:hypothetical protein [Chromobacterium piscinae]|uniref:hypothetical protein n=1 Tax=Chromobacterium piscinae TaxID=686831 RepID=UPI003F80FF22
MKTNQFNGFTQQNIGMPTQASPVQRSLVGSGAITSADGMEASGWWDTLKGIATTVAPYAGKIAGALL